MLYIYSAVLLCLALVNYGKNTLQLGVVARICGGIAMLCDKCKKNQASVRMQQFINGKKTELNICHECAYGGDDPMNLDDFFQGLMGSLLAHSMKDTQFVSLGKTGKTSNEPECPACAMTYREFKEKGRLGCGQCYTTFRRQLAPIFNSIQTNSEHKGKIPLRSGAKLNMERHIDKLTRELKSLVEQEEYEKAAALRDEIRRLQNKDTYGGDDTSADKDMV